MPKPRRSHSHSRSERVRGPCTAIAIAAIVVAQAWVASAQSTTSGDTTGTGALRGGREAPELLRDVRVAVRTTPDSLTVGDRMTVELLVDAPKGYRIAFPERIDASGPAELVDAKVEHPQPSKTAAGRQNWVARYKLAVFRVGDVALAPFAMQVQRDSLYATTVTDSIRLYVSSVLDDSLAAADMRDIKPQAKLPVSRWPWIAGGVALLAALIAFLWWRRRRRPRAAVVALPRLRPAHELALEALRRLESQRLPLDGKFNEHHVRLSEILRRYLEDGFAVPALEETTEEILFELDRRSFDRATLKQVAGMCAESDLVKFAKHEPSVEDCVRSLERVREFVVATAARSRSMPPAEPVEPVGAAATGDGTTVVAGIGANAAAEAEGKTA